MQEGGATVEIEGLILVFLYKLQGRLRGPVRVMSLKGLLEVAPVNLLGLGKSVLFH